MKRTPVFDDRLLNQSIADIAMPMRMQRLPVSSKGYPVPWFVANVNGEWDFRVIAPGKIQAALAHNRCWLCGDVLGSYKCFVIGPMCCINRTSAEPPSHLECAQYAARACPFLTQPNMRRNEKGLPEDAKNPAGIMIKRNPGVTALWVTKSYKLWKGAQHGGVLFRLGDPTNVFWFAEGRIATRTEVDESIRTGLPTLENEAKKEGYKSQMMLAKYVDIAMKYLPKEMNDS